MVVWNNLGAHTKVAHTERGRKEGIYLSNRRVQFQELFLQIAQHLVCLENVQYG